MIFFLFSSVQQNERNKMLTIKKQTVPWEVLPILSVTVIMLSDMVDSVMVLNDEHCRDNKYSLGKKFKIFKKNTRVCLRNLIE